MRSVHSKFTIIDSEQSMQGQQSSTGQLENSICFDMKFVSSKLRCQLCVAIDRTKRSYTHTHTPVVACSNMRPYTSTISTSHSKEIETLIPKVCPFVMFHPRLYYYSPPHAPVGKSTSVMFYSKLYHFSSPHAPDTECILLLCKFLDQFKRQQIELLS